VGLHGDHDDYGLPKADVVVPDDARELDRDVIAYRRELRQERRRARWQRLGRPFTRYGIAAPFIASAVLVALISGVLMTVVSPRPAPRTIQVPPTGPTRLRSGEIGGPLPPGTVVVGTKRVVLTDFINVAGVVVIVPTGCACDAAVTNLARQAGYLQLQVWLIADGRTGKDAADVHRLAETATHGVGAAGDDPDRVLSSTYKSTGLTAVLVRTDRIVRTVLRDVPADRNLTTELRALQTPS
jgi:hypothetical protein